MHGLADRAQWHWSAGSPLALMFRQVGLSTEQLGIYIMLSYFSILLKLVGGIPLLLSKNKAPVDTIGGQAIPTQRDVP